MRPSSDQGSSQSQPGEGEKFDIAGAHLTWKVKGEDSGSALSICEQTLAPVKTNRRGSWDRAQMFAIGHAATAPLIKPRFRQAQMLWLLLSVQLMELLWLLFNYVGLEQTTTESTVESVSDIHLLYIPYSQSIASGFSLGFLAWLMIGKGLRNHTLGIAVGLGIVSHLILDLVTHAPDIAIAPAMAEPKFGLGLYSSAPLMAFFLEIFYGMVCWWIYQGGRALLIVIVLFNLANLSLLLDAIPGPEQLLAGRSMLVVTLIAVQIGVTLTLVGIFSRRPAAAHGGTDTRGE